MEKMKLVKEWVDGEYKISIWAEFKTKGYDASRSMTGGAVYVDCVEIMGVVGNNRKSKNFSTLASSGTHYEKEKWYSRKRVLNIKESYGISIDEMKFMIEKYIERDKLAQEIEKTDTEITDGLPDSLIGM